MNATARDRLLMSRPFLFYVPALAAGLGWALPAVVAERPGALLLIPVGLLAWTLLEWSLHRAMHVRTRSKHFAAIQDRSHLRHHREPEDLPHSVVRLSGSIPLALLVFAAAWLALGDLRPAVLFQCGVMLGYLWYETVHLASHARWGVPVIAALSRYHMSHHYSSPKRAFGVTSPLWDWVFGSLPSRTGCAAQISARQEGSAPSEPP